VVQYAAKRWTVDGITLHPKADNRTGKLIHNHPNPMGSKQDRFGPELVLAPEIVLGISNIQSQLPMFRGTNLACGVILLSAVIQDDDWVVNRPVHKDFHPERAITLS
jgi:hypothetical protein